MSLDRVTGNECLQYIDRPIGFCSLTGQSAQSFHDEVQALTDPRENRFNTIIKEQTNQGDQTSGQWYDSVFICRFDHNISKRKIGLVTNQYDDGGYRVVVLGDGEYFDQNVNHSDRNTHMYFHELSLKLAQKYDTSVLTGEMDADGTIPTYPEVKDSSVGGAGTYAHCRLWNYDFDHFLHGATYEEMIDYTADIDAYNINTTQNNCSSNYIQLTNDPEHTLIFGDGIENSALHINLDLIDDPLQYLQGNLYALATIKNNEIKPMIPRHFDDSTEWRNYEMDRGMLIYSYNMVCVPYNLILTSDLQFAQNYLTNGTLPPDAFLFPLNWNKLPSYDEDPNVDPDDPSDNPPDEPDDNTPNDEDDTIIDNPPIAPDNVPAMFTNYNWYWLSIGDYSAFINWFWNDIGNFSDFDDIINKVKGLYNDLASAVIMVRYMPVDVAYIGGMGNQQPLKIGMIQKASGSVDTLAMGRPPIVEIGSIQIDRKYKSFLDMSPYSQLALYLPYHGYIDLDINVFSGHLLVVYGVYDVLSGTLQYMIYRQRDNKRMLVNTIVCKIAVDIPITLQTKNDRDSAIFQNVSSTVGGLIGAVGGMASGNPIGAMIGLNAGMNSFTSSNASAPLNVKGTVAEMGAMYAPHKCSIILRHPTIQGSDSDNKKSTWLKYIGRATSYGYTLGSKDMIGSGLCVCSNPRITFTNSTPLQSEIDEIYEYLEKGVVL